MSVLQIPVAIEDKITLATEIDRLGKIQHVHKMTYDLLAQGTHFKASKVRNVLQDMLNNEEVIQYDVPSLSKAKRYIYFLTEAGKKLLAPEP